MRMSAQNIKIITVNYVATKADRNTILEVNASNNPITIFEAQNCFCVMRIDESEHEVILSEPKSYTVNTLTGDTK